MGIMVMIDTDYFEAIILCNCQCIMQVAYLYAFHLLFICFVIIVKYVQFKSDYQIHCNTLTVIFIYPRVVGATEPCTLKGQRASDKSLAPRMLKWHTYI